MVSSVSARREYFCAYSRASTRRNASLASVASSGSTIAPNESDLEFLASLGQRAARAVDERLCVTNGHVRDEAELVASETIRRTVLTGNRRELRTEAGEQRVSRRVAEAVVVALEAVQVEDHQENWRGVILAESALEVPDELASIAETRENVGDRLELRELEEPTILVEGHNESHDDEQESRRGEHDRE